MTNNRITSDLDSRMHHNVLNNGIGVEDGARILAVSSGSPEAVSTIVVEISGEEVTMNERHLNTIHEPVVSSNTEGLLTVVVSDGEFSLVSRADGRRIKIHLNSDRSLINFNTNELGDIGATSEILIENLHSVRVLSSSSEINCVGSQIIDSVNRIVLVVNLFQEGQQRIEVDDDTVF